MPARAVSLACCLALALPALAAAPAEPWQNPYLADSAYAVTHGRANYTPLAGPTGPSRKLKPSEITWKPLGPVNGNMLMYSSPYPDGRRVIWVGGYNLIAKLDADTLETLALMPIAGKQFYSDDESRRHVEHMDSVSDEQMREHGMQLWRETMPTLSNWYRLLTRDNELFIGLRDGDGRWVLKVFGDADASGATARIALRREWKFPPELVGDFYGMQMTSDGWVVMAMKDGTLVAVSRDLKTWRTVKLPSRAAPDPKEDFFTSFIRNSMVTDEHGGVYVVTRENLHRVQWTGNGFSLAEADGAWSAPYPNALGFGSGTTPSLMGWGPHEDHLVTMADATPGNNMMVFWRDAIPADWKGIPGYDRRVAGVTKVVFGVSADEKPQVENSIVIHGYGAFIDNTEPVAKLPDQGSRGRQWMAESFTFHVPGHEAKGGTKIEWDPASRTLKTAWSSQLNFASGICSISGATDILYCWTARDREWNLEGIDWNTGNSAFHYTLGRSHRYNVWGGPIIVAPNGAVDCACSGGLGMVRVKPR